MVYGHDTALYNIMIHDLLSSGVTYLCVDNIVDDVIIMHSILLILCLWNDVWLAFIIMGH